MQAGAYDTVLILFYFSLLSSPPLSSRATPFFTTADVYPSPLPSRFRLPTNQSGNNFALPARSHWGYAFVRGSKKEKESASRVNYSIYATYRGGKCVYIF